MLVLNAALANKLIASSPPFTLPSIVQDNLTPASPRRDAFQASVHQDGRRNHLVVESPGQHAAEIFDHRPRQRSASQGKPVTPLKILPQRRPNYLPEVDRADEDNEEGDGNVKSTRAPTPPNKPIGTEISTNVLQSLDEHSESPTLGLADLPAPPLPSHSPAHGLHIRRFMMKQYASAKERLPSKVRRDGSECGTSGRGGEVRSRSPRSSSSLPAPPPISKDSSDVQRSVASSVASYPTVSVDEAGSAPVAGRHGERASRHRFASTREKCLPVSSVDDLMVGQSNVFSGSEYTDSPVSTSLSVGRLLRKGKLRRPKTADAGTSEAGNESRQGSFIVFSVRKQSAVKLEKGTMSRTQNLEPSLDSSEIMQGPLRDSPTKIEEMQEQEDVSSSSQGFRAIQRLRTRTLSYGKPSLTSQHECVTSTEHTTRTLQSRHACSRSGNTDMQDYLHADFAHLAKDGRKYAAGREASSSDIRASDKNCIGKGNVEDMQISTRGEKTTFFGMMARRNGSSSVDDFTSPPPTGEGFRSGASDSVLRDIPHSAEHLTSSSAQSVILHHDAELAEHSSAEKRRRRRSGQLPGWMRWRSDRERERESEANAERLMAQAVAEIAQEDERRPLGFISDMEQAMARQVRSASHAHDADVRPWALRNHSLEYFGRLRRTNDDSVGHPRTALPIINTSYPSGSDAPKTALATTPSETMEEINSQHGHGKNSSRESLPSIPPSPPTHSPQQGGGAPFLAIALPFRRVHLTTTEQSAENDPHGHADELRRRV